MRTIFTIYILLLFVAVPWGWAQQENAWRLSGNPVGISYEPNDSVLEAGVGYQLMQTALAASDQPDKAQTWQATVYGRSRLGSLWLAGGIDWTQSRLEGREGGLLTQPDYLVVAGDTLGEPQRLETYRVYGQAAYIVSPRLRLGISGDYIATDNQDRSSYRAYTGGAHWVRITGGLVYERERSRLGLALHYTHRTEQLSYGTNDKNRLYCFPLGYSLPMAELGSSNIFRSVGNRLGVSLQAELHGGLWKGMNDLSFEIQKLIDNPNTSGNLKGWEEHLSQIRYLGRFTRNNGRWSHIISPSVNTVYSSTDRVLQSSTADLSVVHTTFAIYQQASRQQIASLLRYEMARDDAPDGASLSWHASLGWNKLTDEYYAYPFTIRQSTDAFVGEIAFARAFALPKGRLHIRPSLYGVTGSGVEEEWTEEALDTPYESAEIRLSQSKRRVAADFVARTATRLGIGAATEYRFPVRPGISTGFRLKIFLEQTTSPQHRTGGGGDFSLVLWL